MPLIERTRGFTHAATLAGARRPDVWVSGKPRSEEVADPLLGYGISAGESVWQQPSDQDHDRDSALTSGDPRGHAQPEGQQR